MKKIEIYLSDSEYASLTSKIASFEKLIAEKNDSRYSDEERAEIINAFGSVSFYMKKALGMETKELDSYISMYRENKKKAEGPEIEIKSPEPEAKKEPVKEKEPEKEPVAEPSPEEPEEKEPEPASEEDFSFKLDGIPESFDETSEDDIFGEDDLKFDSDTFDFNN